MRRFGVVLMAILMSGAAACVPPAETASVLALRYSAIGPGKVNGCSTICGVAVVRGFTYELTATSDTHDWFQGWSGACSGTAKDCLVVMVNGDKDVVGTFLPFKVDLHVTGVGVVGFDSTFEVTMTNLMTVPLTDLTLDAGRLAGDKVMLDEAGVVVSEGTITYRSEGYPGNQRALVEGISLNPGEQFTMSFGLRSGNCCNHYTDASATVTGGTTGVRSASGRNDEPGPL